MTYTDNEIGFSYSQEGQKSVSENRRFTVFSTRVLEVLREQFEADFSAMVSCDNAGKRGISNPKVLFTNGAIPHDLASKIGECIRTSAIQADTNSAAPKTCYEESGLLLQVLEVSDSVSIGVVLGLNDGTQFGTDIPMAFTEVLARFHGEISDAYLISRQAIRIESLLDQLEKTEDLLTESNHSIADTSIDLLSDTKARSFLGIKTYSEKMKASLEQAIRVGQADLSLLIKGEVGTGKAFLAHKIHEHCNPDGSPFELISCGSLTPSLVEGELFGWKQGAFSGADQDRQGLFERANGGTVFLDEVGELPMEVQQKLLRVIQEGVVRPIGSAELVPVSCRIIASSCRDLQKSVQNGSFREDLYYRLAGFQLEVPSLKEREEDIELFIDVFLKELREEHGSSKKFSESAAVELKSYSWPGNIQQLKNVIQQCYLISEKRIIARKVILSVLNESPSGSLVGENLEVTPEETIIRIPRTEGFNEIVTEVERAVILAALRQHRGNKSRVTKHLKIPRQTLYNKLERYGFTEEEIRG